MVKIQYSGRKLQINDQSVELRQPIGSVIEIEDIVLVRMKPPSDLSDDRNVVAFNDTGQYLWEIEAPGTNQKDQTYMEIEERDGRLIAHNWNGYTYEIDIEDGSTEPINYTGK